MKVPGQSSIDPDSQQILVDTNKFWFLSPLPFIAIGPVCELN